MKKSIIAGASVLALAGAVMPMAGVFAAGTAGDSLTDTINVTVSPSCDFVTAGSGSTADSNQSYDFTGTNGQTATPGASGAVHTFNVFCNDNSGYTVSASAHNLSDAAQTPAIEDIFAYVGGNNPTLSGDDGQWHAQFAAGTNTNTITVTQIPENQTSGTIVTATEASATAGETFTATYSVYIGQQTPAGTYSGTIEYTLASAN